MLIVGPSTETDRNTIYCFVPRIILSSNNTIQYYIHVGILLLQNMIIYYNIIYGCPMTVTNSHGHSNRYAFHEKVMFNNRCAVCINYPLGLLSWTGINLDKMHFEIRLFEFWSRRDEPGLVGTCLFIMAKKYILWTRVATCT